MIHYFNTDTKIQSKQWCEPEEEPALKARADPSVLEVRLTVFWDCEGIIFIWQKVQQSMQNIFDFIIWTNATGTCQKQPGKMHGR